MQPGFLEDPGHSFISMGLFSSYVIVLCLNLYFVGFPMIIG